MIFKKITPPPTASDIGDNPFIVGNFNNRIKRYARRKWVGGFSLVELLVTVGIFSFISVSIFVKNSNFNSSVLLTNLAYDVALSIREAQIYGLSVREFNQSFDVAYGVNMNSNNDLNYIFFADADKNGRYDVGDGLLENYSIKKGNRISDFCATPSSGSERCKSTGDITSLDITFLRPNPDAIIKTNLAETYGTAKIYLESPSGSRRTVVVESTGQISVQNN